ncbi:hypothetical protein, partial [Salmonella sp. SAL4446]|uniref:hypothetical protein n=1 Tax=Salmonella sp. SAL4446 TaxID=3159901 RepID=UPI00397E7B49
PPAASAENSPGDVKLPPPLTCHETGGGGVRRSPNWSLRPAVNICVLPKTTEADVGETSICEADWLTLTSTALLEVVAPAASRTVTWNV